MADTLSRLAGPAAFTSGTSTVFTGTSAHIYTIRNITIVNRSGSIANVALGIGGVTDALLITPPIAIDNGGFATFSGLEVLSGAETLQVNTDQTVTISVNGLDQN